MAADAAVSSSFSYYDNNNNNDDYDDASYVMTFSFFLSLCIYGKLLVRAWWGSEHIANTRNKHENYSSLYKYKIKLNLIRIH